MGVYLHLWNLHQCRVDTLIVEGLGQMCGEINAHTMAEWGARYNSMSVVPRLEFIQTPRVTYRKITSRNLAEGPNSSVNGSQMTTFSRNGVHETFHSALPTGKLPGGILQKVQTAL
ncbi:hypothetical protein TNCV_1621031 [Trichonephila clavipes]|nr:hypothetical protein TNCV_1621031 [Trichonephila clavipes]